MALSLHTGAQGAAVMETNGVLHVANVFGYKSSLRIYFLLVKSKLMFCKECLFFLSNSSSMKGF